MRFLDETCADSIVTFPMSWQSPGMQGVMGTVSGTIRLITVLLVQRKDFYLEDS
jgi:hypothetical protein